MQIRLISFLLFLLPVLLSAQQEIQLDKDYGFMNISLGKQDSIAPFLEYKGRYDGLNKYKLPKEKLTYNGIRLRTVNVFVIQNEVHSIDIKTTGEDTKKLLALFRKRYGPGKSENALEHQILWFGEKCVLTYEFNILTDEGLFSFISYSVDEIYKKSLSVEKYGY